MTATNARVNLINQRLHAALDITYLTIQDDSELHRGHIGAASGGGHFTIRVVSSEFSDKKAIERHQMIYQALGDAMGKEIHALSINAKTPAEAAIQASEQ
jgi:BolA protein